MARLAPDTGEPAKTIDVNGGNELLQEIEQFRRVVARLDPNATLVHAWALTGGISAQVTALEIARAGGQTQKLVVRRHGPIDLAHNPQIAADEFRLLQILQTESIAAPAPYFLDASCEIFPTPYLIMEFIEGETDFAPANLADQIRQLASKLAAIHRIDGAHHDLSFLPEVTEMFTQRLNQRPSTLDNSFSEGRIRAALTTAWPLPPLNAPVLLHGDYWPGNILWQDGQLAAVIDWEDVAFGDPLADLANARLELLFFYGPDATDDFTRHYLAEAPIDITDLPYWDLCVALRPIAPFAKMFPDEATANTMRERHRSFVERALEAITGHRTNLREDQTRSCPPH
ncbi:MAG TPA: phosphotransferase [Nitrolancea sp.]|nr:phosphotransferase [Nitrolancea sp.]